MPMCPTGGMSQVTCMVKRRRVEHGRSLGLSPVDRLLGGLPRAKTASKNFFIKKNRSQGVSESKRCKTGTVSGVGSLGRSWWVVIFKVNEAYKYSGEVSRTCSSEEGQQPRACMHSVRLPAEVERIQPAIV